MDYGQTAPLYPRGDPYPWGTMHGTENLDHPDLRRWKATAVCSPQVSNQRTENPHSTLLPVQISKGTVMIKIQDKMCKSLLTWKFLTLSDRA